MAHGNERARLLAAHDSRDARAGEHVALLGAVLQHHGLRLGMHENGALGDGDTVRLGLVGYVDHAHLALGVYVRQLVAAGIAGGPKDCRFACIGLGDCTKVCKFDAIHIVDGVAKVDKDKCTGCGACANICPKKVIMIDAAGPRKPVVMCSNKDKGAVANKLCTTSCIACGMCERTCKFDAIHVVDGVARIDYDKCKGCGMCAQKCPKHIILFPLKDDPYPPKPVVKPAAPAAAKPAAPAAKPAEAPKAE